MRPNSNYLNKSYYVAMIMQCNDELRKEGFRTETRKKILFGDEVFIADLYAEKNGEKRLYEFLIEDIKEGQKEKPPGLKAAAAGINAEPVTVKITPPFEKQIIFAELEEIINDLFITGEVPSELTDISDNTEVNSIKIDEILTAAFEKDLFTFSCRASIFVTLHFGTGSDYKQGEDKIYCENFPLSFTVGLDGGFNCKTIEYEIDLSGFEPKPESIKQTAETKNYISKTKFDKEFRIYQDLSESVLTMTSDVSFLFLVRGDTLFKVETERSKLFQEHLKKAAESCDSAGRAINKYAPFVPKRLFKMLEDVKTKCRLQILRYGELVMMEGSSPLEPGLNDELKNCAKRAAEICDNQNAITDFLRTYIDNLDVKE